MTDTVIVRARGISKEYPSGVRALEEVDLTIREGERFVLLGPNGAGKSTLVRIISSLSRPDLGRCDVCGMDPQRDARRLMERIGVVTQDNDLDPQATGRELLRFQGRLFGLDRNESGARAEELIEALDLTDHADKRVETLSGGNKRKLHCALALVHRPRLLFLDEPTVGMDPEVRARFWGFIRRLNRDEGITLVLTTQYLEEAERHAEEMALLRNGRIVYRGSVETFIGERHIAEGNRRSLEEGYLAYLQEAGHAAH